MAGNLRHVINMANSIIGVSILSMPYCFKETGLILGVLLILLSGFITKKTCMFLVRSAIMARRRSYELLAFQVFGVTGKLFMELCMILFLIGICISFHVVMGDLAPAIVAKYMEINSSPSLRCTLLIGMVLLVILPLCLLRNLDSLASMSACSIGFYVFLNCVMFYIALPNLLNGSWINKAELFHLDNAFRVLPIITLALTCQSNVFEIYDSIPDPDVIKMKSVVSQAVNICCALYIGVGFLGYVAFVGRDIEGNVIMDFPISNLTDVITLFFVFSLAISFPLILFPCRTSIHSLIYKRNTQISYDIVGNYMPEARFKGITLSVLTISLMIGIMLPNIEFVLGLLGSTMGMIIAFILPSVFYIKVYTKSSCDRLMAQGFFLLGVILMVSGTYLHLSGLQTAKEVIVTASPDVNLIPDLAKNLPIEASAVEKMVSAIENKEKDVEATGRKEPAIPEPPVVLKEEDAPKAPVVLAEVDSGGIGELLKQSGNNIESNVVKEKVVNGEVNEPVGQNIPVDSNNAVKVAEQNEIAKQEVNKDDGENLGGESRLNLVKKDIKDDDLHPDAIKKEEKENAEEAQEKGHGIKNEDYENKQEKILKQMEIQQNEQKKLIEEQKKLLQEFKEQQKFKKEDDIAKPKSLETVNQQQGNEKPQLVFNEVEKPEQNNVLQKLIIPSSVPAEEKRLEYQQKPRLENNVPQETKEKYKESNSKTNDKYKESNKENIVKPVYKEIVSPSLSNNIPQEKDIRQNLVNKDYQPVLNKENKLVSNDIIQESNINNMKVEQVVNNIPDVEIPLVNRVSPKPINVNVPEIGRKVVKKYPSKLNLNRKKHSEPPNANSAKPFLSDQLPIVNNKINNIEPNNFSVKDQNNKIQPDAVPLHHDEERRKRDTERINHQHSTDEIVQNLDQNPGIKSENDERNVHYVSPASPSDIKDSLIVLADRLTFDTDLKQLGAHLKGGNENDLVDVAYDTRHLLWVGRRTRRKKRRQEQFPEYSDEM